MIKLKLFKVIVCLLFVCLGVTGEQCRPSNLVGKVDCKENEVCEEKAYGSVEGTCLCKPGLERSPETSLCVSAADTTEAGSGSHLVAGILIPLLVIVLVITAFYYNKKYRFISLLRYKISQRYNSNYDDLMIGQDDD